MRIAYIILAHKNPAQVVRLVNALNEPQTTDFFIHFEKAASTEIYRHIVENLKSYPNVYFLKRYKCPYLGFGTVEATVKGLNEALRLAEPFDYLINLSGQDYPIKTNARIREKLQENENVSYIWHFPLPFEGIHPMRGHICQRLNRIEYWHLRSHNFYVRLPLSSSKYNKLFSLKHSPSWLALNLFLPEKRKFINGITPFGGAQWWCLNRKHAEYVRDYINANPKFYSYFKYADVPDEMFFQTLLMNSPYENETINDDLRLLYHDGASTHTVVYGSDDYPTIAASKQLFARKFDITQDERILDMIDEHLLREGKSV